MMKTTNLKYHIPVLLALLSLVSCSPKNPGYLTLVNSGIETARISVDGRTFTVRASNHITKEIASGGHKISVDNGPAISVNVAHGRTTVFDSTGLSCYAVADYTGRYSGGAPVIVERFKQRSSFVTSDRMASFLGSYLPKEPAPGARVLRVQQVDCEIIDSDPELVDAVSNLQ